MKNIHFIAIGGSAMHNLAIALHKKGYHVTGSDDEIFEPSKSRLDKYGLLPKTQGWEKSKINESIDVIILGMHAKKDNPELNEALAKNIPVYSYPEFLYEQTQDKKRIAIAGSHGKTTTTAMIMHVLKFAGIKFDYMVGANLDGFETMVDLEKENEIAIFEADEYLSSPIDPRSKFLWYKPHISVITGIAWDHINVFPTFESYTSTFESFINSMPEKSSLFYYYKDEHIKKLIKQKPDYLETTSYQGFEFNTNNGESIIIHNNTKYRLNIFGQHNMENLKAAWHVCKELNIIDSTFFDAMRSFKGAARRLQILESSEKYRIYFDFAHAPSKVKATINAVKQMHKGKNIIACLELHTFSSLNKHFLPQYKGTMNEADKAIIYFNPKTIKHKNLEEISIEDINKNFDHPNLETYNKSEQVFKNLSRANSNSIILIMTSGNFDGVDIKNWALTMQ